MKGLAGSHEIGDSTRFAQPPEVYVELNAGDAAEEVAERRAKLRERLLTLGSPLIVLAIWEAMVRLGMLDARFFPAPTSIIHTFVRLIASGELLIDLRDTLVRLVVGLLMGGIPGLLIGAAMGLSRPLRAFLKPLVAALFPIPKIAILPLILLMFGFGEISKYVSVASGVIFLMLINTMAGVMAIEDIYIDVGKNFGASRWQFFRMIAVPGAMPGIVTGLQISMTVALLICVATEFVGAKTGVGYLIWESWQTFDVQSMYCGLVVCAMLGFAFQLVLDWAVQLALPWKPHLR